MGEGQRALMRRLYAQFGGDREMVLTAYTAADERGEVRRARNSGATGSREYAVRLWANGMNQGWLAEPGLSPTNGSIGRKALVDAVPLFEEPLMQMGWQWRDDSTRPRPSPAAVDYWEHLIETWCSDRSMPLLVRKGGHRAILGALPSGRAFVRCDNSPAHWAYMGCCRGEQPTLDHVRLQLAAGELPLAMARARSEKALIDAGTHQSYGGFISKSKYGQVNKFTDGRAYKLCHLRSVGLGSRGEVEDFDEATLQDHMRRLLSPSNMIVVPLRYAGVGECQAFLAAFLPTSS